MIAYLKARLSEAATWSGIGVAVAAAAVVPPPFAYAVIVCGIAAIMVPDGRPK